MTAKKSKEKKEDPTIARNKKANFEYHLESKFEAGLVLVGWEVKSLRMGKAQIAESHVIVKKGELWLLGSIINPLSTTSTHLNAAADRTRKLLLNKREINNITGHVQKKGYTIVPTRLYWKKGKVKLEIALAKGKKLHDKRQSIKEREWNRDKQRMLKTKNS